MSTFFVKNRHWHGIFNTLDFSSDKMIIFHF